MAGLHDAHPVDGGSVDGGSADGGWADGGSPDGGAAVRRLLVVDDDDAIREVAKVALEVVGGWDVRTADSGHDAVAIARTDPPDAVLLDVMMPAVDGPTTVGLFRADPTTRAIPIIFLTAKVQAGDRRVWADLDLAGVIAKPFDPMTLAADISALLGWDYP